MRSGVMINGCPVSLLLANAFDGDGGGGSDAVASIDPSYFVIVAIYTHPLVFSRLDYSPEIESTVYWLKFRSTTIF